MAVASSSQHRHAYGEQMARYFHLSTARSVVIRQPARPALAITRLVSDTGLPERTSCIPSEQAFVVSMHLTPAARQGCEIWVDDRYSRIEQWPAGGVGIYDLESNPRTRNPSPVDWVHYHVPRGLLDTFAVDVGAPR